MSELRINSLGKRQKADMASNRSIRVLLKRIAVECKPDDDWWDIICRQIDECFPDDPGKGVQCPMCNGTGHYNEPIDVGNIYDDPPANATQTQGDVHGLDFWHDKKEDIYNDPPEDKRNCGRGEQ